MLLLALSTALAQEAAPETDLPPPEPIAEEEDDFTWYVIPTSSYDTDDGLGFGFRAETQWLTPEHSPYKQRVILGGFSTVRGYHSYLIRWDRTGLGRQGRLRLNTSAAYFRRTNDQYYGMGPRVPVEQALLGPFDADDLRRKHYRFTLVQPYAQAWLRWSLNGGWTPYGSIGARWTDIRPYEDSLLEAQQPYGMDGGWTVQLQGGLLLDRRESEIDARGGYLVELSGRWCPPIPGSAGHFGGPFVSARGFVPIGSRVVWANRAMGEWLFGEVPFYEMVNWGGIQQIWGYGGYMSLRGLTWGRFRAPGKAVLNSELRIDVLTHSLAGKPFRWQVVPYVDLGTVWGIGDAATDTPFGNAPDMALGVGLRPIFDEAFVGRLDLGWGRDPVRMEDGQVEWTWTPGFYFTFEHLF